MLDVVPLFGGRTGVAGLRPDEVAGSVVMGVGTSGKGFERIPATSSFSPASDLLRTCRASSAHPSSLLIRRVRATK